MELVTEPVKPKNVLHSSATPEWYTPEWVMDFVRTCLGGPIDFDPCSCEIANRTVKATKYLTKEGIETPWQGDRIYVNPPGDKGGRLPRAFAQKAVDQYGANIAFMCFSISQLATLSDIFEEVNHAVFVFRKRIAFLDHNGVPSKRPAHANAIVFLGNVVRTPEGDAFGSWYVSYR